MKFGTITGIGT